MTIYISQGSAATDFRGGGSFNSCFVLTFFLNFTEKTLWKLVCICWSYCTNKSGLLFWDTALLCEWRNPTQSERPNRCNDSVAERCSDKRP